VDYFLEHEGVLYPQPLQVESDGSVRLYPEAPGRYTLHASWRSVQGTNGWARNDFHVRGSDRRVPQQVKADGESLWVPTAWDAQMLAAHERPVFRAVRPMVRVGATVYDIGANVGLFSTRLLRWVGRDGWLYALEPNPICVYFLRANLERVGARNFTILPVAASSRRGECAFTVNYGSSLIGVGGDSPAGRKPGHQIRVEGASLDSLIEAFQLRPPDFVKLDVEGAEATAVAGMMRTLERHRPRLLIELHGRDAASGALAALTPLGYRYLRCSSGIEYQSADALLPALPDACEQVVGF
jgi:FkbM family methyltransferase